MPSRCLARAAALLLMVQPASCTFQPRELSEAWRLPNGDDPTVGGDGPTSGDLRSAGDTRQSDRALPGDRAGDRAGGDLVVNGDGSTPGDLATCNQDQRCGPGCIDCTLMSLVCNAMGTDCEPVTDCTGQPDFTPCTTLTFPDREYDICSGETCVSPHCTDISCNPPGPDHPLPDTGRISCHDDGGGIACSGQQGTTACGMTTFCGQDAEYGLDTTMIQRFDISMATGPQPVVMDNVTGLMWNKCHYNLGGTDCTSGFDSTQSWGAGSCSNLGWAGYDDWRVPSVHELLTIVNYELDSPAAWPVFPNQLSTSFWTNTTYPPDPARGVAVNFAQGARVTALKPTLLRYRCVRTHTLPTRPVGRYAVAPTGDRLVVDGVTGLTWQGCANGQSGTICSGGLTSLYTWSSALAACESLTWRGLTAWRLPNVNELSSLIDYRAANPPLTATGFPNLPSAEAYWTSTTIEVSHSAAWAVSFTTGHNAAENKMSLRPFLCVHE